MSVQQADIYTTRKHFLILDGLRGVAALAVVIFHFMEWIFPDPSKNFIGHGFLAVDFFFCLSGFVIGYAYDNRIKAMGVIEFFKSRLIRLHPMVVFGSVLGLAGFLFDPFANNIAAYSAFKIFILFICSILLIPLPIMQDRGYNLFGLNAPTWSLFWEYIANIFYAIILCRISNRTLKIITFLSAIAILYVSYRAGNLLGGWGKDTAWDAAARVSYSFSAGLLVYRSGWIIKNRLGFTGLAILLAVSFVMPHFKWNWLTEAVMVIFYFPLLVSLGAGAILEKGVEKICKFSGDISYPLYTTHYFAIWIFGNYYNTHQVSNGQLTIIIIITTVLLIAIAYFVMMFYDIPVRRYLNSLRQKK